MDHLKLILASLSSFLRTVIRSCYDMELYRGVRTSLAAAAFRYFAALNLLLVILVLCDLTPAAFVGLRDLRSFVSDKLPSGASLTLKAGQMSSGLPQPFALGDDRTPVVIDTGLTGLEPPASFTAETGVLVGRDAVFIKRAAGDVRTSPLKDLPDFSVTRDQALGWLARGAGWVLALALLFFALVYYFASLLGGAVFVIVMSPLALFIGRLWKLRLSYWQWVAVGFHAMTLPALVNWLFDEFGSTVPLAFTFLFFMVIVAVIADERASPVDGQPAAPRPPRRKAGPGRRGPDEPTPPSV